MHRYLQSFMTRWVRRDWLDHTPPWLLSFAVHVVALVVISVATFAVPLPFEIKLTFREDTRLQEVPEDLHFKDQYLTQELGAASVNGQTVAMAMAPTLAEIDDISDEMEDVFEQGDVALTELDAATTPLELSDRVVSGVAGVGVSGASGAIDRITHEILLSMEDRDTLVVWFFDRSGSLARQRKEINERLERIYRELGLIREDLSASETRRHPLLTSVVAFGKSARWMIEEPTADVEAIKQAVASITLDESGIENVFTTIYMAAEKMKRWTAKRNVMLVVVSDEVGDDQSTLERTVRVCRRNAMPVYVVGVPAVFGRSETLLKWVDPDRRYDQSARWGRVNQGPESLHPERVHLPFSGAENEAIDSGFGPFALTRLCYQTGGIYFAIHPNRNTKRRVRRGEIDAFSSHLAYFFDPQRMRPYRPDYVSVTEYLRRVKANPARAALIKASEMTNQRMESPATHFVKRDEAQFASELTEAQKTAAKLEPKLSALYRTLKQGEDGRDREESPRWQAAFDLAMGQTLAVSVRTRAYNEMLALAKRGLNPEKDQNNTWTLLPDADLSTSSRLEKDAERARDYLQQVVRDHEGTPWAMLAQRELAVPLGWRWRESFTPLANNNRRGNNANNNQPATPRDDERRMLQRPPRRAVPKL